MTTTLSTIHDLVKELSVLQPLKAEFQQRLDKKIRLAFNYNSNHLEGNTLTYGETELLLIFDKTTGNHELREYEEMKAHDVAFEMIKELATDNERPLNEAAIKKLHEVLLVRSFWKEAITPDGQSTRRLITIGDYKKQPNSVRLQNGEIFDYASPSDTPILMGELVQWYKEEEEKKELHPVELAALLHYRFVRIHPFDDGNGRLSRLLMNYVLLKHNLPVTIIKSTDKKNYFFALNQADADNLEAFINYIAEQLVWSLEIAVKAAREEDIEEDNDFIKEIRLIKKRTENAGPGKTPRIVCDVFNAANKEVWYPLNKTLDLFNELFTESRTEYIINDRVVYTDAPEHDNAISDNNSIWGYNTYNVDIKSIEWYTIKYGLRDSKDGSEFEISFTINFKPGTFNLKLRVNLTNIYSTERKYDNFLLTDICIEMNNKLKEFLLNAIKKKTKRR